MVISEDTKHVVAGLKSPTMMTSHGGSETVPRQIRRMLVVCARTPAIDRYLIEYVAI